MHWRLPNKVMELIPLSACILYWKHHLPSFLWYQLPWWRACIMYHSVMQLCKLSIKVPGIKGGRLRFTLISMLCYDYCLLLLVIVESWCKRQSDCRSRLLGGLTFKLRYCSDAFLENFENNYSHYFYYRWIQLHNLIMFGCSFSCGLCCVHCWKSLLP